MKLREAVAQDSEAIWRLRNEESARRFFFNEEEIPLEQHQKWWPDFLARPDAWCLIAEAEPGCAVAGYVRFEVTDAFAEISICVAPERRGMGLGTRMIAESCQLLWGRFPAVRRVTAQVRESNKASAGAFAKAGFRLAGTGQVNGMSALTYVLDLPPSR